MKILLTASVLAFSLTGLASQNAFDDILNESLIIPQLTKNNHIKTKPYSYSDPCSFSKRNGALVIENQRTGEVIERAFASTLMEANEVLVNNIRIGKCALPDAIECDITKRDSGYGAENSIKRNLLSHLKATPNMAVADLSYLVEIGICAE